MQMLPCLSPIPYKLHWTPTPYKVQLSSIPYKLSSPMPYKLQSSTDTPQTALPEPYTLQAATYTPLGGAAQVRSMQMFRRPVPRCAAGDRVGICVTQLDPKLIERGLACAPGSVPTFTAAIAAVEKIRFFQGAPGVRSRFQGLALEIFSSRMTPRCERSHFLPTVVYIYRSIA